MSEKKFSKKHEWVLLEGDVATVGITKHATELLGDIVFAEVPDVGKAVEKEIMIFNAITQQAIFTEYDTGPSTTLDITGFLPGKYFIRISDKKTSYVTSFVVE